MYVFKNLYIKSSSNDTCSFVLISLLHVPNEYKSWGDFTEIRRRHGLVTVYDEAILVSIRCGLTNQSINQSVIMIIVRKISKIQLIQTIF